MRRAAILAALTACTASLVAVDAHACAPAPPEGAFVSIANESAIVVWDEASKTEHFIRRASFRSEARDFGFLVPTPTKPELEAARDEAFAELERAIAPKYVTVEEWSGVSVMPLVLMPFMMFKRSAGVPAAVEASSGVTVLEEKRVAGYDAAVLEADSATALADWLRVHGYAKRPALEEWLAPYVDKRWKLTAFKIASDEDAGATREVQALGTSAVRMTFQTDRPFFPYREPRDQRESVPADRSGPRALRVFFLGPARVSGAIGDGATAWRGETKWAGPFDASRAPSLPFPPPSGAWLTAFEDDASPRPGVDELFFSRATTQAPFEPPPIKITQPKPVWIPLDVVLVVGGGVTFFVMRARSRRSKERSE